MSHLDPGSNGPGLVPEVRPQQPRSPEVLYNQAGEILKPRKICSLLVTILYVLAIISDGMGP